MMFYSCYPDEYFRSRIERGLYSTQAGQKFHKLLVKGFCANGIDLDVLFFFNGEIERDFSCYEHYNNGDVSYKGYLLTGNLVSKSRLRIKKINTFIKENKNKGCTHIVIDALNPYSAIVAKQAKKNNISVITYITDFYDFVEHDNSNLIGKIKTKILFNLFYKQFNYTDYFILLTDNMKEKIHKTRLQYVVIDGLIDANTVIDSSACYKYDKTVFLYTGAICKLFGLENLVKAFIEANITDAELHLYGNGDYVDELKEICKTNTRIKYFGIVPNEEIAGIQKSASFLINPRPVSDEYNKYSFPSKTMEYLLSGVPTITTRLPSIGDEYSEYLNYFSSDDITGLSESLVKICCDDYNALLKKATRAKEFVLREKNNAYQCSKILHMLRENNLG